MDNLENKYLDLKKECIKNNIPILLDDSIKLINNLINNKNIESMLEIGTAVGFSAISFCRNNPNLKCYTIEKNKELYTEAKKNISNFNLEDKIFPINADALDYDFNNKVDLLFIDAAKTKYSEFFTKYSKNININGYIVCDNLNLKRVKSNSKRVLRMRKKLNDFKITLLNSNNYQTKLYLEIGDGLSISKKIK